MDYLMVPNLEKYQHYKDRTPPWIKLHNSILEDYEFGSLPDASKYHLVAIWLLASRTSNKLPADSGWISKKIEATGKVNLDLLVEHGFLEYILEDQEVQSVEQDASKKLSESKQNARERRERRGEREGNRSGRPNGRFTPPSTSEVQIYVDEKGYSINADKFVNFYASKDWMIGKNKMKSWKHAVANWASNEKPQTQMQQGSWK